MDNLESYKRVVRDGFKLNLSDRRIEEIWNETQARIEKIRLEQPERWQKAEERKGA